MMRRKGTGDRDVGTGWMLCRAGGRDGLGGGGLLGDENRPLN